MILLSVALMLVLGFVLMRATMLLWQVATLDLRTRSWVRYLEASVHDATHASPRRWSHH